MAVVVAVLALGFASVPFIAFAYGHVVVGLALGAGAWPVAGLFAWAVWGHARAHIPPRGPVDVTRRADGRLRLRVWAREWRPSDESYGCGWCYSYADVGPAGGHGSMDEVVAALAEHKLRAAEAGSV